MQTSAGGQKQTSWAGTLAPAARLQVGRRTHLLVCRQVAVGLPHNVLSRHRGVVLQAVGSGPLVWLDGCRGGEVGRAAGREERSS